MTYKAKAALARARGYLYRANGELAKALLGIPPKDPERIMVVQEARRIAGAILEALDAVAGADEQLAAYLNEPPSPAPPPGSRGEEEVH